MRFRRFQILFVFTFMALSAGCTTVNQKSLLSKHPIHATQMSNQPEQGYLSSGVWRIRGRQNTLYIAGTSPSVTESQIPFPSPFYVAYQDSQEIYVEANTDISFFGQLRLLYKVWPWFKSHKDDFVCPKGRNLSNYLSPQTLERLRVFYGKDFSKEQMTPLFLLVQSEAELIDRQGSEPIGVDDIFMLMAHRDHRPIRELDENTTEDTTFKIIDEALSKWKLDIAKRGIDAVIAENMLDDKKDNEDDEVWRRGNLAAVEHIQEQMKSEDPSLYEKGILERNPKWLEKIKRILQGKKNVMMLVGIVHLGGKDGLLQMLQQSGFTVEQMYGVDRPVIEPAKAGRTKRTERKHEG